VGLVNPQTSYCLYVLRGSGVVLCGLGIAFPFDWLVTTVSGCVGCDADSGWRLHAVNAKAALT
jgi:hypothetical protein